MQLCVIHIWFCFHFIHKLNCMHMKRAMQHFLWWLNSRTIKNIFYNKYNTHSTIYSFTRKIYKVVIHSLIMLSLYTQSLGHSGDVFIWSLNSLINFENVRNWTNKTKLIMLQTEWQNNLCCCARLCFKMNAKLTFG